ncbi:MAG: Arc family DNA-binding protein [Gemmatimonadaceae bacterium]|jgi:plasmid stability protein|nr:Arc family DNA-binding protein [Gemmatimonadaceae bacterium]
MPTLTLKNVPEALIRRLRSRAAAHGRSVNSEILHILDQAIDTEPMDVETTLARVDALRERLAVPRLTDNCLTRARSEGRA